MREEGRKRGVRKGWNRNEGKVSRNSAISDDPGQELGGMITMICDETMTRCDKFFGEKRRGEIKDEINTI